jgi:hypothetical protein
MVASPSPAAVRRASCPRGEGEDARATAGKHAGATFAKYAKLGHYHAGEDAPR